MTEAEAKELEKNGKVAEGTGYYYFNDAQIWMGSARKSPEVKLII